MNVKTVWENHPSRIKNNNMVICKICNSPAPKGEISRWGNVLFVGEKMFKIIFYFSKINIPI